MRGSTGNSAPPVISFVAHPSLRMALHTFLVLPYQAVLSNAPPSLHVLCSKSLLVRALLSIHLQRSASGTMPSCRDADVHCFVGRERSPLREPRAALRSLFNALPAGFSRSHGVIVAGVARHPSPLPPALLHGGTHLAQGARDDGHYQASFRAAFGHLSYCLSSVWRLGSDGRAEPSVVFPFR